MFAETGTSYTPVVSYVDPDMQPEANKRIHGRCASLLSWVCCLNTQTIPDSDSCASDTAEVAPASRLCCSNAQSKPVPSSSGSVPLKKQGYVSRARGAVSGLFSRRKHQASGARPAAAELPVAAQIKSACSASGIPLDGLQVLSMTAASESGKVALLQQQPSQDRLRDHGVVGMRQHEAQNVDQGADMQHDAAPAQPHQVDADGSDSQPADSRPSR